MMLKTYSVSNINVYIYFYYLSGYFRRVLILPFLVNFAQNWKKQNYKFCDFSFILSHSNKGIKHSGDFDKKIKREYLGRITDNVDFFS